MRTELTYNECQKLASVAKIAAWTTFSKVIRNILTQELIAQKARPKIRRLARALMREERSLKSDRPTLRMIKCLAGVEWSEWIPAERRCVRRKLGR